MKKTAIIFIMALLAAISCTKDAELWSDGPVIDEVYLSSSSGSLSVAVEATGVWRVSTEAKWITLDVDGGLGKGAFTFYYTTNEASVTSDTGTRTALITVCSDDNAKKYHLRVVQQGFNSEYFPGKTEGGQPVKLEFRTQSIEDKIIIVCTSDGAPDAEAVRTWAEGHSDLAIVDDEVIGGIGEINARAVYIEGTDSLASYPVLLDIVDNDYNASPYAGSEWIVAGKMNHYSMMQTGYPDTPKWYPADPYGDEFRSDRLMWKNNLFDCVWMSQRSFVRTFSFQPEEGETRAWQADYAYLSKSVLSCVYSVELLDAPVEGMTHKAIQITLKY